MNTTAIRQRLHNYLEAADDKKVKAIYTIIEREIEDAGVVYTEEFKAELDQRHKAYQANPSSGVSAKQSKQRIQKILNAGRK